MSTLREAALTLSPNRPGCILCVHQGLVGTAPASFPNRWGQGSGR